MLETHSQKRGTSERLSVVESKVSKLDNIESKVTDIQIHVAKIEQKIEHLVDHIETHTKVDKRRLDAVEDFMLESRTKNDYRGKIWTRVAMIIGALASLVAIYINLKGK